MPGLSKNTIKVAHLNIQSISNKLGLLKDFLAHNEIDIMCLNETLLNANKQITIPYYSIIRNFSPKLAEK